MSEKSSERRGSGMNIEDRRIFRLVLTGGPCGGKTTGQARLSTFFENLGWKVYRVPETGSLLIGGGVEWTDLNEEQGCQFQENLLKTMLQIEETFLELAKIEKRNTLVICDRGAMDASAFIEPKQWESIIVSNGWNNVQLRDKRYDLVVHMVTAAKGAVEFYTTDDHPCRKENIELARELDTRASAAWIGHPYFEVIDNSMPFEEKIRRLIAIVCQKAGVDPGDRLVSDSRKRKFLIRGTLPPEDAFPPFQDFDVIHHYLTSPSHDVEARLRKRGQKGQWTYTHTLRKPQYRDQIVEVKTQLTHREYVNLLSQSDYSRFVVYKTRRCFIADNKYFQLDIYRKPSHPRCDGLLLLETYSPLAGDLLRRHLPQFLNIQREVTGDPSYSMYYLSLLADWDKSPPVIDAIRKFDENKCNGHQETQKLGR